MPDAPSGSDERILSAPLYLFRKTGAPQFAILAVLMLAASLSEGVGLLMLVPLTRAVAGGVPSADLPSWLVPLQQVPFAALLGGAVALVSLRAVLVYALNERRRMLALDVAHDMRIEFHQAIQNASWRWLSRQRNADLAAQVTGEVERAASLSNQLVSIAAAVITIVVLSASAASLSWELAALVFTCAIVVAVVLTLLRSQDLRAGDDYAQAYGELQANVGDVLRHIRASRIAGSEGLVSDSFHRTVGRLADLEISYFRASHRSLLALQIFAAAVLAGLIFVSLELWQMPLAIVLPVVVIFARIAPLAGTIQQGVRTWRYNAPALARLRAYIREAGEHRETQAPAAGPVVFRDRIKLSGVTIHYRGRERPALEKLDLTILRGSIVGIGGPSGSGKSSLADLLCGLILPDEGQIEVDGLALSASDLLQWRRQVAYLEQDPFLLNGSIAANLAWGKSDVTEADMWQALESASAHFVHSLPSGLETQIGDKGHHLSGGERQRIALARVFLTQPDLLILDEVTTGLDGAAAEFVLRSITQFKGKTTVVALSHDQRVLGLADEIVTLNSGDYPPARIAVA